MVLIVIGLVLGVGSLLVLGMVSGNPKLTRDQITQKALKEAKQGLLAYAVSWPNRRGTDAAVSSNDVFGQKRGPGLLPCPDIDNSGAANQGGCGNESGSSATGQISRLGRLPFRTLGLPDLRDGSGERLWYAVSSKYKTSDPNYDLNPDSGLGTITIRSADGTVIHDGTNTNLYLAQSGGVAAVVISPGAAIERWNDAGGVSRTTQDRGCGATGCTSQGVCNPPEDTVPRCMPVNYLEKAWGLGSNEDNADFVDRNDVRAGNANGFISGPISRMDGSVAVNDQLVYITYDEIMQAVMHRVALEVANCLDLYAAANAGRYPYPAPVCRSGYASTNQWSDRDQILFGRVPAPPFDTTRPDMGGLPVAETWAMTGPRGCTLDTTASNRWWLGWRNHVFIAIADNYRPGTISPPACTESTCLQVVDSTGAITASGKRYAVIVSGRPLADASPSQTRAGGSPLSPRLAGNYVEGSNAQLERLNNLSGISECSDMGPFPPACSPLSNCNRIQKSTTTSTFNDVVYVFPP
ncbi:MAG: hypothetical protein SF172_01950 [Burkholderiales bacterium]|nr:hypothetical protein [Burkholderiales bacterium]